MLRVGSRRLHSQSRELQTTDDRRKKIGKPIGPLGRGSSSSSTSSTITGVQSSIASTDENGKTMKIIEQVAIAIGAIVVLVLVIGFGLIVGGQSQCCNNRKDAKKDKRKPLAGQSPGSDDEQRQTDDDDDDDDDDDNENGNDDADDDDGDNDDGAASIYGHCVRTDEISSNKNNNEWRPSRMNSKTTTTTTTTTRTKAAVATATKAETEAEAEAAIDTVPSTTSSTMKAEDSSWFGWVLGSTGVIAEDKEMGNNITYGEI